MRIPTFLVTISLLLVLYVPLNAVIWEQRQQLQAEIPAGYVIPSKYSRVLSLGNRGLLSDYLFLKLVSFLGGRFIAGQSLGEGDREYLVTSLDVITDLDPYFQDPYFLAEGLLAWDAGMPVKANEILSKGMIHRPQDWMLPFFIGFNHFYFLKDYAVASDYIMRAAKLPGSPPYLKTLAGRLAYYGGKTKTALLFLQQMIAETDDPLLRTRLSKRLLALERAVIIEEAVEQFKVEKGRLPTGLNEILSEGYLAKLPPDPYGGQWGLLTNGRVFSTSKFADPPPEKDAKPGAE